ncbi:MAG: replication-associated recombination protein A, partial [Deltaproteobacteria bacterium]|nr:replication-associated recombination protein A [Deltaproteobacteria bacterium]
ATAPKSNTLYLAEKSVIKEIKESVPLSVPMHLRNAPTKLMKEMGYSHGYMYPHDYPENQVKQEYLPEKIRKKIFYHPGDRGFEKEIKKRVIERRNLRVQKQ